jgi:phospholipase/carboxylesterase
MIDLAGLAPSINRRGYIYTCPNAPIPFDLGGGQVGSGWTPPRGQATPEEVRNAETLLGGFFDEVFEKLKTKTGQAVLMGFSQGGAMTYRCGLARPETFAGLVALSASLSDPKELEGRLPQHRSQPVFMAHGRSDPLVPLETAWAIRQFLEQAGYRPEYREYAMGHEIPQEVLDDLVPWMTKVLPPFHS